MPLNLALFLVFLSSSSLNIHLVSLPCSHYGIFLPLFPVVTFLGHPSFTFIIFTLGCCTHICGTYLCEVKLVGVGCRRIPSGEHQGNDDLLAFPYSPAGCLLKMGMLVLEETAVRDTYRKMQRLYMYISPYPKHSLPLILDLSVYSMFLI